jgi:hypothetical protein
VAAFCALRHHLLGSAAMSYTHIEADDSTALLAPSIFPRFSIDYSCRI